MTSASAVNKIPLNGNAKTTSQEKVEANRRNSQRSPGPTSAEGKKISSRNASKHGLLIKDVVITTRDNKEDQAEFDSLLAEMRDCYSPVGIAEDLLVRELTISYWRSARALRCERGNVTCAGAEPHESELSEMEIAAFACSLFKVDAYNSLLETSRGLAFLLRKIEEAQDEVRVSDSLSTELRRCLAPEKNWEKIFTSGTKRVLAALEKEAEELTAKKGQIEEGKSQWRNDARGCSAIPSKEVLDRIHRYETSNVRHRYRVEVRLERLQARRRGNAKANSGGYSDAESSQDTQFCETKPTGSRKPPVSEARARVAALEERGAPPEADPIGSPTNETVATAESDVLAAEQIACPSDSHTPSWTDGGDGAESRSDEADEAAQEESGVPPEVDPIGSPTNETVAALESDLLLPTEQTRCPTDAHTSSWTDGGDAAESRSDEPDEAGEA